MNKNTLKLILDLPQSVNHIYGRNKFGSTYLKKEGKDYKKKMSKYIRNEAEEQQWIKPNKNKYIFLDQFIYMNKAGRDADNTMKLIQDCINDSKSVWEDDTCCLPRTHRILIDKFNPRVEMVLSIADYIGVFDNKKEYLNFINTYCNECTRGEKIGKKGGCSIYKKALENRIQENLINDSVTKNKKCLKFKHK